MNTETFGQRVKRTTRKVVRIVIISAIIIGAIAFAIAYWGVYDDGVRAGTILRISKRGVLFKTYEGQIDIGTFGGLKNVNPIAQTFDFSVEDEQVVRDLQTVALTGERVNLHYIKRYVGFPWRGDTRYFAIKVERITK
jgi:hypothetical protein